MTRPAPGTAEEDIYERLIPQMSRAGRVVDLEALATLAADIQRLGHKDKGVRKAAKALGLDPRWLPRRRRS